MLVVAPAEPRHVRSMAALLAEMDRFYGAAEVEPLGQRIRQITDALFGESPAATRCSRGTTPNSPVWRPIPSCGRQSVSHGRCT